MIYDVEAINYTAVDLLWDLGVRESIGTLVFKCSFKYLSENISKKKKEIISTLTGKSKSRCGGSNSIYVLGIAIM